MRTIINAMPLTIGAAAATTLAIIRPVHVVLPVRHSQGAMASSHLDRPEVPDLLEME